MGYLCIELILDLCHYLVSRLYQLGPSLTPPPSPVLLCVFFITELNSKTDLQTLSGKTLSATSGSSSPGPVPATSTLLCPYVNLLLCNAQPSGEEHFGSFFFFFLEEEAICFIVFLISLHIKYVFWGLFFFSHWSAAFLKP